MFTHLFLFILLFLSVVLDLLYERIPNWLIAIGILYGLFYIISHENDWYFSCIESFIIFLISYLLFIVGALGGGDAKLLVVISFLTGYSQGILIIFGAFFVGAIFSIGKTLYHILKKELSFESFQHLYIHFSIPIAMSTVYFYYFGGTISWINI